MGGEEVEDSPFISPQLVVVVVVVVASIPPTETHANVRGTNVERKICATEQQLLPTGDDDDVSCRPSSSAGIPGDVVVEEESLLLLLLLLLGPSLSLLLRSFSLPPPLIRHKIRSFFVVDAEDEDDEGDILCE